MNDTDTETSVLDEFTGVLPKKTRWFNVFAGASLLFIVFLCIDLWASYVRLQSLNWKWAGIFLLFPVSGILLHLARKKIAWIINGLYYFFLVSAMVFAFAKAFSEGGNPVTLNNWRALISFLLIITCTVILLSAPIRNYFRINNLLFVVIAVLAVGLAAVLAASVYI